MKHKIKKNGGLIGILLSILLISLTLLFASISSYNADTTGAALKISPGSGEHLVGEEFTVDLIADGGGQSLTSFGGDISVDNLTVVSLTKGSVDMWKKQPDVNSLNFLGGVFGQTNSIVIYSLKVKGNTAGDALIHIANGSIQSTDGYTATEILSSQNDGRFTIKSAGDQTQEDDGTADTGSDTNVVDNGNGNTDNTGGTTLNSNATTPSKVSTTTSQPKTTTEAVEEESPTNAAAPAITPPVMPTDQTDFEQAWLKYKNQNTVPITLSIDKANLTTDPATNQMGGLIFKGKTTPNVLVSIYLFSSPIVKSATADEQGNWLIAVPDLINGGNHSAYALATASDNSSTRSSKLSFNLDPTQKTISKISASTTKNSNKQENSVEDTQKVSFFTTIWFKISLAVIVIIVIITLSLLVRRKNQKELEKNFEPINYWDQPLQ